MSYAELQVTTNFSFLEGASHPEEMVGRAAELGHAAIAITDRNSLAGIVRAHGAAREAGLRLVIGARLDFADAPNLLCYPTDRAAYGRLCRLLTIGKRRAPKGECHLALRDLLAWGEGQIVAALPPPWPDTIFRAHLETLREAFGDRLYLAAHHLHRGDDARRIDALAGLAEDLGIALVAAGDVRQHDPRRRPLQDVLTCIREKCTIREAGRRLHPNAERHLKSPDEMGRLFRGHEVAVARSLEIVARCDFNLDELRHEYPTVPAARGRTPQKALAGLVEEAARLRYPEGVPEKIRGLIDHELALVAQLGYAPYFLTVWDIVRFARERGILCQGRGSAANSAICYLLGITSADPETVDLLVERFISVERNEPPDIDVDFEHERREEVIQYIYERYGRDRAGLAAVVIRYRSKSALRDVGKVMGLSGDTLDALSRCAWGGEDSAFAAEQIREAGLDPTERTLRTTLALARELIGFPRHMSQHPGGFVITRERLDSVAPVENAAMAERTIIPWDKDDLDQLGLLKIDVLALGALTCIRKCLDLIALHHGRRLTMTSIPLEDPAVYDMLCRADAVGVFQVESRAQMAFLPRMRPRCWYDLVIEVAIIRPGPITGDMVHPYLRRRRGEEPVVYPSGALRQVLEKTLGVPLFQEQAMRIAVIGAGFTPGESDQLRRAMATFRRAGTIQNFREKFLRGMAANGYEPDFAERCWQQIEGFGTYGFPESHAVGFAQIAYLTAWLKCHYPAAFAAGILNSQPMGFYAPAQLVRDAAAHGVPVLPPDVNHAAWDSTLEVAGGQMGLRLGLRLVKGLGEAEARCLIEARGDGYRTLREFWTRTGLTPPVLERLADADAFRSLGLGRRKALWEIRALGERPLPLFSHAEGKARQGSNAPPIEEGTIEEGSEPAVSLPVMPPAREVVEDYRHLGLTLREHPLSFLRAGLAARGAVPAKALDGIANGRRVTVAGLVLVRQRPGTAKGVIFVTLEDESGWANVIVWPNIFTRFRKVALGARLLVATGQVQKEGQVIHVIAERLTDGTADLDTLIRETAIPETGDEKGSAEAAFSKGRNFH
jgi:error-prone DNA polymerase